MYLDQYRIDGTINYDMNPCFTIPHTYPNFQEKLEEFQTHLVDLVNNKECKTFYKFGDGDYFFLKKESVGSAGVGKRALSKSYDEIKHEEFVEGVDKNDYMTCEIYPENVGKLKQVSNKGIDYPAEYGYGLVANKWLTRTFAGRIGLIGAGEKLDLIKELLKRPDYKNYLGLDDFNDYIHIPQKFACDDIDATEKMVAEQLKNSTSDIFLVGIGHVKSALLHRLKEHKNAVYLDVGSSIDALAGIIDYNRPYFGGWKNYRVGGYDYEGLDLLQADLWGTSYETVY